MIRNQHGDLYTGISENPQQRLTYHNENRGARFTKRESLFEIVFLEEHPTLSSARTREIQIKKWRREKKDLLITRFSAHLPTKPKT